MSKKSKKTVAKESVLDFEEAKTMTVAEASKKQAELEVGITEKDGLLDRYIKQHREQIEAGKFETKQIREAELAAAEKRAAEEALRAEEESKAQTLSDAVYETEFDDEEEFEAEKAEKRKKLLGIVFALLALFGISLTAYSQRSQLSQLFTTSTKTSSTKDSASASAASSSSDSESLKAFNDLYATFFTDENQTALKNDSFGQLQSLETALSILEGTVDYDKAKAQFDKLKAAIEATQAINANFDKPVIVNGEIDTTATAKSDAEFTVVSTGITSVDKTLVAAVNFGRSQQESGSVVTSVQGVDSSSAVITAPSVATLPSTLNNGVVLDYAKRVVYGNEQVNLQRNLSRVPYNDAVIADASNEAWVFTPNVLETIIATSNQRGYFSGNDFILEKVNIINGRGYYNMFKLDGTYLFSINAKTGYFVGNGSGYADDLDY